VEFGGPSPHIRRYQQPTTVYAANRLNVEAEFSTTAYREQSARQRFCRVGAFNVTTLAQTPAICRRPREIIPVADFSFVSTLNFGYLANKLPPSLFQIAIPHWLMPVLCILGPATAKQCENRLALA
jgi:hypothetical protein